MTRPNVLCIAIDGWHAGYVGAYGNTQFATPGVDRWAAHGVVCDRAIVAGTGGWGLGAGEIAALAQSLAQAGWHTNLVSDDGGVLDSVMGAFDEHVHVPRKKVVRGADAVEQTQLFRFFATLGDAIADTKARQGDSSPVTRPFFIWSHARAMQGAWDAPYAMRRLILDEDDPDPPRDVEFTSRRMEADVDPDLLLGLRAAYAGQVAVLDECLAALDGLLDESGLAGNTLVAIFGVRGFPLGEHGVLGLEHAQLHEELIHVPLLLRFPGNEQATLRLRQLVTHADLAPTLLDACGLSVPEGLDGDASGASLMPLVRSESGGWRDYVCHRIGEEVGITTPAWRLRKSAAGVQLFVKPDDRWEVNDVAARCGDTAEKLVAVMEASFAAVERGETPPVLDDELRDGL